VFKATTSYGLSSAVTSTSSPSMSRLVPFEADAPRGRLRRAEQLPDRIEHDPELSIVSFVAAQE
jgi:hypothetical protein